MKAIAQTSYGPPDALQYLDGKAVAVARSRTGTRRRSTR